MRYSKTVRLKDGRTCIIRNGTQQDAQGVWDNFVLTHGETEFLTTYPEEVTYTLEQEEAYLKQKEESDRDAALLAEVDGKIVGTAGIDSINAADLGLLIKADVRLQGIVNRLSGRMFESAINVYHTQDSVSTQPIF